VHDSTPLYISIVVESLSWNLYNPWFISLITFSNLISLVGLSSFGGLNDPQADSNIIITDTITMGSMEMIFLMFILFN
jgi:hypothetical protein